eukprot:CAMPEP_0115849286 /NCGR_PEP_ID=MMETSP0287-20121206/11370_1 /TAXON_ID=412157 /ORGANISM="Chrysochromulina rotalis, Strain UIO044" /LENGTH=40 /DNA_ID= /DNA_START= /DNA_END= /DNA_ORIENTATION=
MADNGDLTDFEGRESVDSVSTSALSPRIERHLLTARMRDA